MNDADVGNRTYMEFLEVSENIACVVKKEIQSYLCKHSKFLLVKLPRKRKKKILLQQLKITSITKIQANKINRRTV